MTKYPNCLITGGSGTYGVSYTCKAIEDNYHSRIVIFSRDEYKQLKMSNFLKERYSHLLVEDKGYALDFKNTKIRFFIGDVQNQDRLITATKDINVVIHSAALKHVPICEYNPIDTVYTNIIGTINVVKAAAQNGVRKVVGLSTDKSVCPINIYGASKLCLEKVLIGGKKYYHDTTQFSICRYGNILGSRGSVVDLLLKGQNIKLTDPEMTRFWLTIEESIDLTRFAIENSVSGEIFVPKLKSTTMKDLFSYINPDKAVDVIGARLGEKQHEEMISLAELSNTYDIGKYYVVNGNGSSMWTKKYPLIKLKNYTSNNVKQFSKEEFLEKMNTSIINEINKIF